MEIIYGDTKYVLAQCKIFAGMAKARKTAPFLSISAFKSVGTTLFLDT